MKVSYCTTCKGRLHHLKKTLPANLEAERDNPDVEFVVLDYSSDDGLGEWIRENYSKEIESGKLRYARYDDAPHFKMAHAKNMAHRLATGDILCNLDADNYLAPNFSTWLKEKFTSNPNGCVTCIPLTLSGDLNQKIVHRLLMKKQPTDGMCGRVALSRNAFEQLGGYDEYFSGWGSDDINMVLRAREYGLDVVNLPPEAWGHVIKHGSEERLQFLSDSDQRTSGRMLAESRAKKLLRSVKRVLSHPDPVANLSGNIGCGNVRINFNDEVATIHPFAARTNEASPVVGIGLEERYWRDSVGLIDQPRSR